MKPTQTEIERFILAYHPCRCVKVEPLEDYLSNPLDAFKYYDGKIEYIELRSIDSLTDEELRRIAKILGVHAMQGTLLNAIKSVLRFHNGMKLLEAYDKLREWGIAVPSQGYTVEQWLESGILKIKG